MSVWSAVVASTLSNVPVEGDSRVGQFDGYVAGVVGGIGEAHILLGSDPRGGSLLHKDGSSGRNVGSYQRDGFLIFRFIVHRGELDGIFPAGIHAHHFDHLRDLDPFGGGGVGNDFFYLFRSDA